MPRQKGITLLKKFVSGNDAREGRNDEEEENLRDGSIVMESCSRLVQTLESVCFLVYNPLLNEIKHLSRVSNLLLNRDLCKSSNTPILPVFVALPHVITSGSE